MSDADNRRKTAVALEYERTKHPAPRIVAKGHGNIAEQIVRIGEENGVVIEANAELAEALSHVALEQTIPEELYRAVAEVIGFVFRTREKMN